MAAHEDISEAPVVIKSGVEAVEALMAALRKSAGPWRSASMWHHSKVAALTTFALAVNGTGVTLSRRQAGRQSREASRMSRVEVIASPRQEGDGGAKPAEASVARLRHRRGVLAAASVARLAGLMLKTASLSRKNHQITK
jgi:hypothetical protein